MTPNRIIEINSKESITIYKKKTVSNPFNFTRKTKKISPRFSPDNEKKYPDD